MSQSHPPRAGGKRSRLADAAVGACVAALVVLASSASAQAVDEEPAAAPASVEDTRPDPDEPIDEEHTEPEAAPPTPAPRLFEWDARWGRSGIPNFILIGTAAVLAGSLLALGSLGRGNPTRGGWLFDEEARSGLRLHSESDRLLARDISDVLLTVMTSMPLILDAFVLAAWEHDSPDVAFELVFIHAEVAAVTLALQVMANVYLSRERPYGRTCGGGGPDDLPEVSGLCNSPERNYSFFSGHTSQAFASAAVVCSAHMNLPLLGGGDAEIVPCLGAMALAATTGMLRIAGDMHYVTDVIIGATIGTTVGFLLPWLLHYRHRRPGAPSLDPDATEAVEGVERIATPTRTMVTLVPTGAGIALFGIF